jgi:putative membrane protein
VDHDGGMMEGGMMGMMGGWMLLWALVGLALLVIAVLAAIWLVKHRPPARPDTAPGAPGQRGEAPSAQELLRRRYAAGEVDREEYLRMQRDLSGG